ncbi:MAG TPA: DEAD/DEAH box helicase, partial [Verrucomicrobiae bacterium]|nr:DEAD/DEAH box helicase [Verrucomicrobiae bacterium]
MRSLARRLENGGVLPVDGIDRAAQPFFAVLLRYLFPTRPIVVVLENLKIQENFFQDIETWMGEQTPLPSQLKPLTFFYPSWGILPDDSRLPHVDVISDRMQVLIHLREQADRQSPPLVVTSVSALMERTFTPEALRSRTRQLQRGDRVDPLSLAEWLEEQGYEPEAQVSQKGEISLRGGILDVFPPTGAWPVRLEFFGDELESLREFDPLSQVSREEITTIILPPAGEVGILRKFGGEVSGKIAPPSEPLLGSFLDYLPGDTIVLLADPARLAVVAGENQPPVSSDAGFFVGWEDVLADLARRGMPRLELTEGDGSQFSSLDAYRPVTDRAPEPHVAEIQRREFFSQVHRWLRQGYAVHVFCNNEGERRRFEEIRVELGLARGPEHEGTGPAPDPRLVTHIGTLSRGFVCDEARLVVVTDAEIFGRYKVQRPRRLKSAHAQSTRSALEIDFSELAPGDLVVHVQHGIARYQGLQQMPLGTRPDPLRLQPSTAPAFGPECLVLEFAASDPAQPAPKLYVPVSEAHLVSKYVGSGKARPPLSTLGGTRWAKAMIQAESAVRDVASDLLSIQAARESQPGHPFAPDLPWQREFESAFIYEETPDQVTAIQQTKADMERPKPMDRLICGDVGFGKTEVAIRAAFKAVMDGKQVAVLVPTTVLAQQHFNTFRERMADYPVRIELLSRFRTRRQQDQVVRDLGQGAVDIVIGTHRLLQGDIRFKDLGLVIIDEEQRFGVMHKETFKMFRKLVDVLTLSATPIPRTLYLALSGARDMSTIQTPPHDRLPVETIVTQYDERIIRDAIQRELQRGGQVFFLYNRVLTIHTMAQKLRALVPQAR